MNELQHHGVKGQRWGVRRKRTSLNDQPVNKNFKQADRQHIFETMGLKSVLRVNQHMNEGKTYDEAVALVTKRNNRQRLIIGGAFVAASLLLKHGPSLAESLATSSAAKRGASELPALMSKAADLKYSKKRGGVYKITTL